MPAVAACPGTSHLGQPIATYFNALAGTQAPSSQTKRHYLSRIPNDAAARFERALKMPVSVQQLK